MKTFLIILAFIVLIIGILLIANFKIKVYLSDNGYVVIKYLFLRFKYDVYGDNKLKTVKKKKGANGSKTKSKEKKKDKGKDKTKEGYFKKVFREKGVVDGMVQVLDLIKLIFSKLAELIGKAKVTNLLLDVKVAAEEPSLTAMYYGGVSAVVYPAVGLLNSIIPIENQTVNINADYGATNSEIKFEIIVKLRLYKLISVAFSFIKEFLKGGF